MTERVTLKPGDYVSTEGMTPDKYTEAAKAFVEAGAKDMFSHVGRRGEPQREFLEWYDEALVGTDAPENDGRHLTIDQVLAATNAGSQTQDPLATILESATEHDAKAKHHAADHERLMAEAQSLLPDGWRLVRDDRPDEDMSDPANWREGDLFEVLNGEACGAEFEDGIIVRKLRGSSFEYLDGRDYWSLPASAVRFHHRP